MLMSIMDKLISFFKMFKASDLAQNEVIKLFWHDEDTEAAIAYISTYMKDIKSLQQKYEDQEMETTYEQHMKERRVLNMRLKNIEQKYESK